MENKIGKVKPSQITKINSKIKYIGQTAQITLNGLTFDVIIRFYKQVWGKDRWLVTPSSGDRETEVWIEKVVLPYLED